jgi:hypothetical protein
MPSQGWVAPAPPNASRLAERPAGCCGRITSSVRSVPMPRRLRCFDGPSASIISNGSSTTKNSLKSTTESGLQHRPGDPRRNALQQTLWVGNPSTKAARMNVPSVHQLCAMASRKCERARVRATELNRRRAIPYAWNMQKLEGCGASMRKCLHRAIRGRMRVMAVLVPIDRGYDFHNATATSKRTARPNLLA